MLHRRAVAVLVVLVALVVVAALANVMPAEQGVWARPATDQVVLNPSRDTYLGQGVGSAQDSSSELQAGWVYTTRGREFRTYLEFPLDADLYPPAALVAAELWLYPEEQPQTSQIVATFVVRTMSEPFAEGRVAPAWFSAGDPTVEREIGRTWEWKKFSVKEHVLAILEQPDKAFGFAVSGKEQTDNTRWDFISLEGGQSYAVDGTQPRLLLYFRTGTLATSTPLASATPTDTATTAPTQTATVAPSAASSSTATRPATATSTATPIVDLAGKVFLPRVSARTESPAGSAVAPWGDPPWRGRQRRV
jgi:hypothetical protein